MGTRQPTDIYAMKSKLFIILIPLVCLAFVAMAQKPFIEGTIDYKVRLETADKKTYTGTYIFTFKGGQICKELKLNNGYHDILIINTNNSTAVTLQAMNGKKYAIQLSMEEVAEKQKKYKGFVVKEDKSAAKKIAGYSAVKGVVVYQNGAVSEIYYTKEYYPDKGVCYERFPDAQFMPLSYKYTDESGFTMYIEAEKITSDPVENGLFRIPADYKIISNAEYRQLLK